MPDRAAFLTDLATLRELSKEYDDIVDSVDDRWLKTTYHLTETRRRAEALEEFEQEFYDKY